MKRKPTSQVRTTWQLLTATFAICIALGQASVAQAQSNFEQTNSVTPANQYSSNNQYRGTVTVYSPVKEESFGRTDTVDPITTDGQKGPLEKSIDYLNRPISPPTDNASSGTVGFLDNPKSKRKAIQTGATLVLVLSVFLTLVTFWKMRPGGSKTKSPTTRRRRSRPNQPIPESIVTVLGQLPFVHNQQLQLLRLGSRLLLVSVSQSGSQTLGEISDPNEVFEIESAFETGQFENLAAYFQNIGQPTASQGHYGQAHQVANQQAMNPQTGLSLGSLGGRTQTNQHAATGRTLLEA